MIIANNRKAFFDYHILTTYQAGISLLGIEVKSLREGKCSIADSYVFRTSSNELELVNCTIPIFRNADRFSDYNERRSRKLLLKKHEIFKIINYIQRKGYTVVPTKMYFSKGLVKVDIGVAKGKTQRDKRHDIKERDWQREQHRIIKDYKVDL